MSLIEVESNVKHMEETIELADELQKQLVLFYTYCVEQSQADGLQAFLNTLNAAVFIAREVL